jgi:hypothetical protein
MDINDRINLCCQNIIYETMKDLIWTTDQGSMKMEMYKFGHQVCKHQSGYHVSECSFVHSKAHTCDFVLNVSGSHKIANVIFGFQGIFTKLHVR